MSGSGRALLFDIDGTLADTDALHLEVFNQVFAPYGHVFDRDRASKELMGFSNSSISERFCRADRRSARRPSWRRRKKHSASSRRANQTAGGSMKLLALADRADVPMVAVTNAPRLNAEMMLSGLGIMQRFKAVIIGDELPHGKPHPLPYLEGLRAVLRRARPVSRIRTFCSGVPSASAAGIATIGMRTSLGHGDLLAAGAVCTAATFEDPELVGLIGKTMNW